MRANVLLRYFLFLLIALPVGFLLLYPQLLRCLRVEHSTDFRRLTGTNAIYVHQSATPVQQRQLLRHALTARDRIRRFWGNQRGGAVLVYCSRQADYEQYCVGGEGAGCSLGTPWGTAYLVLGPEGNNADVIAHELCHDELFTRLGWWRVKRQIPQWFNEGLALMVDYRFSSPSVWEQPDSSAENLSSLPWPPYPMPHAPNPMLKLTDLETTRDFFGGDYWHTMLAYRTAAQEVAHWLSVVGRAKVAVLTDAVASGDAFSEAYRRLERAQRVRSKQRLPGK